MYHRTCMKWAGLAALMAAMLACTLPVAGNRTPTPSPTPPSTLAVTDTPEVTATETAAADTDTPQPPTATTAPTRAPRAASSTPPPTLTAVQVSLPGQRLLMKPGRTNVTVSGSVSAGGSTSYLAGAASGQFMMAMLDSASQDLKLRIKAPNGATIGATSANPTFWQGTLPANGDYQITVLSSGGAANFTLSITIPVRISFKIGAVSASVNGFVGAHETNTYLLRALKNQTMTVTVVSPNADIFLTIYGLTDGQPYVRSVSGQTTHTFKLPSTQDYVIECVSTGNAQENYNVTFTVK